LRHVTGRFVEPDGDRLYSTTNYAECAAVCQRDAACVMVEFYRSGRKCNVFYRTVPTKPGGDADIGYRQ
jgi:PAN domain